MAREWLTVFGNYLKITENYNFGQSNPIAIYCYGNGRKMTGHQFKDFWNM